MEQTMKASDVMTRRIVSIESNASVLQAVRLMLQHKVSGLPVVDANGTLVGIVTEGDFLRRAETATERKRPRWLEFLLGPGRLADEYVRTHARKVADVMTPEPRTITEDTPLENIVQLMEKHSIKRLPVVRGKTLVGIVSRANLLHALASMAPTAPAHAASDRTIRERLLAELEHEKWAPIGALDVIVRNGVVELWGAITDERERQALIVAAQNIAGVKDVRDHLVWVDTMSGTVFNPPEEAKAS
jgi:CBS-domain-containing membrane protein